MASSEISQHPVFKEFVTFIRYLPSLDDAPGKFTRCLSQIQDVDRQCHRDNAVSKHKHAEDLWKSFKSKDKCPDDLTFYETVESFLAIVLCWQHLKIALPLFNNWKQHRIDNLSFTSLPSTAPDSSLINHDIMPRLGPFVEDDTPQTPGKRSSFTLSYASDEASLPGTPDSDRVFDSPNDHNITPFSSPPTADYYTPQALKGSGSSDSGGFFLSPSRRLFESPSSYVDNDNSTTDCDQKIASTVAISVTSTAVDAPGDVGKPGVVVETITEINTVSPQEISKELPVMIKKESSIEETTTNISITQANAPVADNPLVGDTAVGKCSLKRQGTLRSRGPILDEIYDYLTPIQLKKGIVYVLQHNEHADIFKIGFSEHSADKRLNQPGNCYRDFYKPIYESPRFFAAHKAEAIAMVFLRGVNLHIIKCYKCGKKHRELFRGDKEKVVGAVQAMVSFVRDGAYEKDKDGVWKLSAHANKKVEFSPMGLLASEELQEEPESTQPKSESESEDTIDAKPITVEHTTTVQVAVDIPIESTEVDESTSKPPALPKKSRSSIGTFFGKVKNKISGPSRESTPEVEDAQEPSKTPMFTEENIVKTLWFLIPDQEKPENCFEDGKGPRTWGSLAKGFEKVTNKIKEDYVKARAG
ncbi:hypothetical protein BKA59DRAFT_462547 [Fusarium tricinctum]|uniref:Bacteriophage T5 Orf172 DNA-binding domain-containing protein n=1 Tax=Fusarium tricinctum TaxID=61284 RepID=A0A8K0WGF9_9HYPO|nr:hypothetical protein BKA59DRAFT_462547 [Fusarium tricinctum]